MIDFKKLTVIDFKKLREEIQAILLASKTSADTATNPSTNAKHTKLPEEDYIDEFEELNKHRNPIPTANIDYVWVLSGRSTYLGNPVDTANAIKDKWDDRNRMQLAIKIVKEVTAARTGNPVATLFKKDYLLHAPKLIYNGVPKHNFEFEMASLPDGTIDGVPFERVTLLPLDMDKLHTGGQFLSVKAAKLPLARNHHFALVTHAFHSPRVSSMVDHSPTTCFGRGNCFAFSVDRVFQAPGAMLDMQGEILGRSSKYMANGLIAKKRSHRIIDKPEAQPAVDDCALGRPEQKAKAELFFLYFNKRQITEKLNKIAKLPLPMIEIIQECLDEQRQTPDAQKIVRRHSFSN